MVGQKVHHKSFGAGRIVEYDGSYLTVAFADMEKKFVYPDIFESFLCFEDGELQKKAISALQEKRTAQVTTSVVNTAPSPALLKNRAKVKQKKIERMNIAFKCNYCNGGQTSDCIGFNGICSDQLMNYNVNTAQHIWCSSPDSLCQQYLNGELSRNELEEMMGDVSHPGFVCYESRMLRDWKANAGIVQTGERKGMPMRLLSVQPNSLAVLTTRRPFSSDDTRFVFAVFLVDESHTGDFLEEGYVTTHSKWKISLTPQQTNKILFWKYYSNKNAPQKMVFGSGLHRYLSDYQAAQILRDIIDVKSDPEEQQFAQQFFLHFCTINGLNPNEIPSPSGPLAKSST